MPDTNTNKIRTLLITLPHTRMSEKYPDADLARDVFAAWCRKTFQMETFICVEEPHRKSVGKHIHAFIIIKKGKGKPFKKIKSLLENEYPDFVRGGGGIDIKVPHHKTEYTNFQYLCEPDYQPKSGGIPKSILEIDPNPIKEGRIPQPSGGFKPFNQSDWARLCSFVYKRDGIILQPNFAVAVRDSPYLMEF